MKNKLWIIIAIIFVAVMVLAITLYPKLAENYNVADTPNNQSTETTIMAEDFTVYDEEMNEASLSDSFGKPIVVNFWASWCQPCKSELPYFDNMYKKYKDNVTFMMVNLTDGQADTVEGIKKFVADGGYSFPVYYDIDYDASNTYGIRSIPETLFINADGTILDIRVGAMTEDVLESYITMLLE